MSIADLADRADHPLRPARGPHRHRAAGAARTAARRRTAAGRRATAGIEHTRFDQLGDHLTPGRRPGGQHLGHPARPARRPPRRSPGGRARGQPARRRLPGGRAAQLPRTPPTRCSTAGRASRSTCPPAARGRVAVEPYPAPDSSPTGHGNRLWRARCDRRAVDCLPGAARPADQLRLPERTLPDRGVPDDLRAVHPGSAEMPSAGRPFSAELVTRLVAGGVLFAPITLHTGVSSQEAGEAPQAEWFAVSRTTADLVNAARGSRRPGDRGRHHRDPGHRVGDRTGRGGRRALAAGPIWSSRRSARSGWSTG